MDVDAFALGRDRDILEAVEFLLENRRTGAPVVNESNELVGLLSEKDCLKLLATGVGHDVPNGKVSDFMTIEVQTVSPEMNIYFVAGLFLNSVVRRFPVVDDGKLVGVITRFDILRAVQKHFG